MKNKIYTPVLFSLLLTLLFSSCKTSGDIPFSNALWSIQKETGYLVSSDSTYRFVIGDNISPSNTTIVGSHSNIGSGMCRYISQICNVSEIKIDSVLCYIPEASTLIVAVDEKHKVQPSSITVGLSDRPYTMWVRDDDAAEDEREDSEIYSNSLIDKRNKILLVIDRFTYKERDIAFIKIIQTNTKRLRNMNIPNEYMYWADVSNPRNLDAISYWIMPHRETAIKNYKLGNKRHRKP